MVRVGGWYWRLQVVSVCSKLPISVVVNILLTSTSSQLLIQAKSSRNNSCMFHCSLYNFFYQDASYGILRSIRVIYRPQYKRSFNIDYREQGSHVRGVYPTKYLAHKTE